MVCLLFERQVGGSVICEYSCVVSKQSELSGVFSDRAESLIFKLLYLPVLITDTVRGQCGRFRNNSD